MEKQSYKNYIEAIAVRAKTVALDVAALDTKTKNNALLEIASALISNSAAIIEANKKDVAYSQEIGKTKSIIDRLTLTEKSIASMASAVTEIAALPDPIGSGNLISKRPNGLKINKIRVPIGVVAMIYESRPNVTSDAAALTLKSGNTVILRGGKESIHSNRIIAEIIRGALKKTGIPEDAVQFIDRTEHEIVDEMLQLTDYIDVVIPRGGESLIKSVVEKSKIPVIKHDKGVCHVYVDKSADRAMAESIVINAKCQRPSVCNAIEKVLMHQEYPYQKEMIKVLLENKVEVVVDKGLKGLFPDLTQASENDWTTEYLDFKITAGIVEDVKAAVSHINRNGSHHSDAIVSADYNSIQFFMERVDSAAVYANASTRFTDGTEFGLGAEVGISTQKIHVRGPMGLEGLTTEKWVVYGTGQIRG